MIAWIKRVFGFKSSKERKLASLRKAHAKLQKQGFDAQRAGKLALAGEWYHLAGEIEEEIVELTAKLENDDSTAS